MDLKYSRVLLLLPFTVGSWLVSGCAHAPIAAPLRHEARKGVTVAAVQQDPASYQGAMVIWGGRIIKTVVTKTGSDLYILRRPLTGHEWPLHDAQAEGRFIAHAATMLDPQAYRPGRRVTVAGTVAGTRQEPIGQAQYAYPVLDAAQVVLWHRRPAYYYTGPVWGWSGWPYYWGDEWDDFGPDWDGWDDGPDDGWGDDRGEGDEDDGDER